MSGFVAHYIQRKPFYVVECKRCRRHVPSGVTSYPTGNIVTHCTLCGELRRYRPSEVFLGEPNYLVASQRKPPARAGK